MYGIPPNSAKKYGQQPQKLTTQTKINQIPPQQYLIYISTYRPSVTLKLPDIGCSQGPIKVEV